VGYVVADSEVSDLYAKRRYVRHAFLKVLTRRDKRAR